MATFGIEGIRYFGNARSAGVSTAEDLTYVFNICNGLDDKLRGAGHTRKFYWANDSCWETDLRSSASGGSDDSWADSVDLFFIITHGNNDSGVGRLLYDVAHNNWRTHSSEWNLGNNNVEWLMMYACKTISVDHPIAYWNAFKRLHAICGAYDNMWDGITTDECGEDVGANLVGGDVICDAWIDGVSDWWVDNHPMVLTAESESTYNGGNFVWSQTTMNRDHYWGAGTTVADVSSMYWMAWRWAEG